MFLSSFLRVFAFLFGLFVANTAIAEADVKVSETAKNHFRAGLAHLDDPAGPKYEEAYREFKTAYVDSPSYEIAVNVGYCAFFLERDAEALDMYERFLATAKEKDISKKKRVQMEKDVQSLRAGLVKVSLKVHPAKAMVTDERFVSKGSNIINRYPIDMGVGELGIHPGSHKFTVSADGFASQSWEFDASPGSSHQHEFELDVTSADKASDQAAAATPVISPPTDDVPAQPRTTRSASPLLYVSAVATGVFVAGAVGMGLLTNSKKNNFEAANDGTQYAKADRLRSDVKTYALVTDLCIGAAVLSAGTTAYFYFAGPANTSAPRRSSWRLTPTVGAANAGMAITGGF